MGRKIVVIGSNSFSGAHFVNQALKKGFLVIGISRSKEPEEPFLPYKWETVQNDQFYFYQYDLNHDLNHIMSVIKAYQPEYIVNFAAQGMVAESWENPEQWLMTNTVSAIKLHQQLKNCRFIKKFVQVSTPEVYGSCEGQVKETRIYYPSTPYAVSKAAVDMSLANFYKQYHFPVVFTRSANVYGSGQQLYRIIPKTVLFFLTGRKIELHGGGRSIRSFIHIKDVVNGTFKAMINGQPGQIYHFSTPDPLSIRSLVELIASKTGVDFKKNVTDAQDRPGKDKAYILDYEKTSRNIDWTPEVDLVDGLDETIEWVKLNLSRFKKQKAEYIHIE